MVSWVGRLVGFTIHRKCVTDCLWQFFFSCAPICLLGWHPSFMVFIFIIIVCICSSNCAYHRRAADVIFIYCMLFCWLIHVKLYAMANGNFKYWKVYSAIVCARDSLCRFYYFFCSFFFITTNKYCWKWVNEWMKKKKTCKLISVRQIGT